uniref:Uncharacterized protein n=1 Tax=Peronospora matthiolae TaxID=2874970 RepID=A0AAV1T663_9STRA
MHLRNVSLLASQGRTVGHRGVYVDDLLATGTCAAAVDRFFVNLGSLSINDLGTVIKFLNMRVTIDNCEGYVLDQDEVIGELLCEHGIEEDSSTKSPIGADCYDVQTDDNRCSPRLRCLER